MLLFKVNLWYCLRQYFILKNVASATLVAKADSIPQPVPWTDMVKEKHELVKQNQALAIAVQQAKSQEQNAAYWYGVLEKTRDDLYSSIKRKPNVIANLEARLANNNAKLISELQDIIATLQDTITTLEEAVDAASWTESRQNQEICRLEERVDSKNISEMEESLDWLRERNYVLYKENCCLNSEVGGIQYQINNMQACRPGMESEMDHPPSKETTSCALCSVETAGGGNYLSDNNLSLFPKSDDDGSN
jgi:hypothetical protein